MRHGNKINHLGRKTGHRAALLKNLAVALFTHKRIETTLAKAKELRGYVEPLITKAKSNTTHSRRDAFSYLQDKFAAKELFDVVAPKVGDRPGGYTRIVPLPVQEILSAPSPKYSTIAPVPPFTVKIPATFKITSLALVQPLILPVSFTPINFGILSSQGKPAITSTASAPPTPIATMPKPPALTV